MRIIGVIWLRNVVEKLAYKHQIETEEVEQVFHNRPKIRHIARGDVDGEDLYSVMGQTDTGRHLITFFIHKASGEALVISARDMTRKESQSYGKKG